MLRPLRTYVLLASTALATLSTAQTPNDEGLLKQFEKKFSTRSAKKREQAQALLDAVRDAALGDPASAKDVARSRARHVLERLKAHPVEARAVKPEFRGSSKPARASKGEPDPFPFPKELAYRFGTRDARAMPRGMEKAVEALQKKGGTFDVHFVSPVVRLEAVLDGASPDLELEWIALTRDLDVDRRGDRFAQFLNSWRNVGPGNVEETFYEALDRTAGTQEAVFFYDVMLAGYTKGFGVDEGKKSVNAAHEHLGRAFLTYRTYRSFVEAVALCLILPPNIALPKRLDRFDYGARGALAEDGFYLLRHRLHMLVAYHQGDPGPVIEFVRKVLESHPLPDDLGSAGVTYAPLSAFETAFQDVVGQDVEGLLQRAVTAERDLAKARREGALQALESVEVH